MTLGLCGCGCGEKTKLAPETDRRHGYVKGEPRRFLDKHYARSVEGIERLRSVTKEAEFRDGASQRAKSRLGVAHPNWKGEDVSYGVVHNWLSRNYPKVGVCETCGAVPSPGVDGRSRTHYAFLGEPGGYARDRTQYIEECVPCHRKRDRSTR